MAVVNINLTCELQEAIKVQYIDGVLFSQDNQANKINVTVLDGGQPATLSGTVSANIVRSDGGTVAASGGSITGNVASITLPAAAYAVPGVVSIVVKLTVSGVITTIAAVVANMYRASTDTAIDPGTVMPSIQTLISQINAAVASIPADYSSLWTKLAPAFSTSASYVAGQYVTYNSGLYRFNTTHTGDWSSSDVTAVNLGGEITDLKSALSQEYASIIWTDSKYIASNGVAPEQSGQSISNYIDVAPGMKLTVFTVLTATFSYIAFYDANKTFISPAVGYDSSNIYSLTVPNNAYFMRITSTTVAKQNAKIVPQSYSNEANSLFNNIDSVKFLNVVELEQGAITTHGALSDNTKRIRTADYYGGTFTLICPSGFGVFMILYYNKDTLAFDSYVMPNSVAQIIKIGKADCVAKFVIAKTDTTQTITVDELNTFYATHKGGVIQEVKNEIFDSNIEYEQGAITLAGVFAYNKKRIRTKGYVRGKYTVSVPAGYRIYMIAYFDEDTFEFDSYVLLNETVYTSYDVYKSGCVSKVVVSNANTDLDISPNEINRIIKDDTGNRLAGKAMLNLGDSIAEGMSNAGKGYAQIIASDCNLSIVSLATSGWTMSGLTDSVIVQAQNAISNYGTTNFDYILVEGGCNDININVDTGELLGAENYDYTQADKTTFAGALEFVVGVLRNKWPTATIIFINVHKMTSRNWAKQVAYHSVAVECCKKWAIPIADIFDKGQITSYIPSVATTCFNADSGSPTGYDRTHPNNTGYRKFYVPVVRSIMEEYCDK